MTGAEWARGLHAAHLCTSCKRQDAYTLAGRWKCYECTAKDARRKRNLRATPDGKAASVAAKEKWRSKTTRDGICVVCGKRKAPVGRKLCKQCIIRNSARRRENKIADGMNWPRGAHGYCWQCNKRMAIHGKRLCQQCIDQKMQALQVACRSTGRRAEYGREGNA